MSNYSASNETKHVRIILLKTKHMQVAYMQKLRSCEIRGTKCITHRIIIWFYFMDVGQKNCQTENIKHPQYT